MNPTTDSQPTLQDRLDAAAGERHALQEELAEMRRRRDAWKERANRLAAEREALQLACGQITEDRDRAVRQAQSLQEELDRIRSELAATTAALEQANARALELRGQRDTATEVAESADLGWKNAAADLEAETKRANRLEAFVTELALAIGQPALRGQELLEHVRETEQLVAELRQVCAEQKHELRCAAEAKERLKPRAVGLPPSVEEALNSGDGSYRP